MNDLISVIVNVYNGEKFIKKCLDSIVNQTYKNLEIIIVNDGSTDSTLDICNSYSDTRIKIITTKNQGLGLSRNTGIDNASGEYLYFVDADDFIESDAVEYLYKLIKTYNKKIATCKSQKVFSYDFIKKQEEKEEITIKDAKEMIKEILLSIGYAGTTWNKLYHKSIFNCIRFEDRIINDVAVTYKTYIESKEIIFSTLIKYYYLKHPDSILGQSKKERQIDFYKASLERYDYIKNIYPDFLYNELGLLLIIYNLYYRDYNKIADFYKEVKMKKKYNELFSSKVLKCRLPLNDKIKLILFRITPRLSKITAKIYIELKQKNKKKVSA
ncbi:MAG: glycosyltransferase family 2 protein [Treponema sp.]|nr:glycosyltransferase family 2 protein [Treponema sp.]